jgi:hypothetical protein
VIEQPKRLRNVSFIPECHVALCDRGAGQRGTDDLKHTPGPVCTESHCVCMVILYTPGPESREASTRMLEAGFCNTSADTRYSNI